MPHLRLVLLNSFFLKKLNIYDQNKISDKLSLIFVCGLLPFLDYLIFFVQNNDFFVQIIYSVIER